jgi:hypothetical protein
MAKNIPTYSFQGPPKFTQTGIFGLKIYHLAILELSPIPAFRLKPPSQDKVLSISESSTSSYKTRAKPIQRWAQSTAAQGCQMVYIFNQKSQSG